jgi:hypothetical protein
MASFYIVPSRQVAGSIAGQNVVTSLNDLVNDVTLVPSAGGNITITPSGQTLQIGVDTGVFLLKAGDTVTGNLRFTPSAGNYGIAINAASSNPSSGVTGAIYYNTVDNSLRIYDGSWTTLGVGNAITQTQADLRYLKLDASNGPLTGDLSLGATKLRLGNFNSSQPSGSEGQIIFRSDLNTVQVYAGGSWQSLGFGNIAITAGTGLSGGTITSTGTISIDQSYPFSWTGIHSHSQPITFASAQTFAIEKLSGTGQTNGAMAIYSSSTASWTVLQPGSANQVLKIDSGTLRPSWSSDASGVIGTPSDGTYTDGFFDSWTSSTTVANAVDDISELLALIAPAKPGFLTAQSLSATSQPTTYTVKLSGGLGNEWYYTQSGMGYSAGNTISTYFLTGSYVLSSPDSATRFYAGTTTQATFGEAAHLIYAYNVGAGSVTSSINATYNLAGTGTTGTSGTLTVNSLETYNNIWTKANAFITYSQSAEGWLGHSLTHTLSGETNVRAYFRDTISNASPTPYFSVGAGITENTPSFVWLSGVRYYGFNSTFDVSFQAGNNIFDRCYNATQVARVYGTGMDNFNLNPVSVPNYNDYYDMTSGFTISLDKEDEAAFYQDSSVNKFLYVALFKAHGSSPGGIGTTIAQLPLARAINTYTSPSTNVYEAFYDEDMRVAVGTTGAFDPEITPLVNGNAQVRNGILCYPVTADYSGIGLTYFSGDQVYERFFYKESASNGTLSISGLSNVASDIVGVGSGVTSGKINVLLQLIDTGIGTTSYIYYDLGENASALPIGSYGGVGTSNLYGGRFSANSNSVTFSFGTKSTENSSTPNLGRYRLIVILKDNTKSITSIASS